MIILFKMIQQVSYLATAIEERQIKSLETKKGSFSSLFLELLVPLRGYLMRKGTRLQCFSYCARNDVR